jgi:hypothetical protein
MPPNTSDTVCKKGGGGIFFVRYGIYSIVVIKYTLAVRKGTCSMGNSKCSFFLLYAQWNIEILLFIVYAPREIDNDPFDVRCTMYEHGKCSF